jgi:hypothetical protein
MGALEEFVTRIGISPEEVEQYERSLLDALISKEDIQLKTRITREEARSFAWLNWYAKEFGLASYGTFGTDILELLVSTEGKGREEIVDAVRAGQKIRREGFLGGKKETVVED